MSKQQQHDIEQSSETDKTTPSDESYLASFEPNRTLAPYPLSEILKKLGLSGPRVPAEQLVGQPFVILAAKTFGSAYDPRRHAYFCVCAYATTGETFTTVLGGWAVVDILDAVANSGFDQPLQVTLRQVEGGRYGRYYVLE